MSASDVGKRCAWCGAAIGAAVVFGLEAESRSEYIIDWICMAVVLVAGAEIQLARNPPRTNSERRISKREALRSLAFYLGFMAVLAAIKMLSAGTSWDSVAPNLLVPANSWDLAVPAVLLPAVRWVMHKRYLAWCDSADLAVFTSESEGDQEEHGSRRALGLLKR